MVKLYSHFYDKETNQDVETFERAVRGKIKVTFPNAYAILSTEEEQRRVIYRIPVIGGINEISVNSHPEIESFMAGVVTVGVRSAGILGDRINRKLRKTLEAEGFEEGVRSILNVSAEKLQEYREREFHLKIADERVTQIIKDMQNPLSTARCEDGIYSHDLGEYLAMRTNSIAEREGVNIIAEYSPKFGKLEVMKF